MSDEQKHHEAQRSPAIDFLVTVEAENRLPIPESFAERFGIEPGVSVFFVDSGSDAEFTVRVMPSTYAGALSGVFGTTEENVGYVRRERDTWDLLPLAFGTTQADEFEQQLIYAKLLGDMTHHFGNFRTARLWFETRQPSLAGQTPLDVIEVGNPDAVIGLVHLITSLAPE
jgi:bifunctional DNA-binding transcriptional regulator/antitoxin component of YhaV-PrlF toxin-antitoxin module